MMFTMKKIAALAVAGFFAASMIGCPDDGSDGDDSSASLDTPSSPSAATKWALTDLTGTGWTVKKVVLVGDANHPTLGSFLDIDGTITDDGVGDFTVHTVGTVGAAKNNIDLIYDGTNLFSPAACITDCPAAQLKTAITGSTSDAMFHTIPSTVLPSMGACAIHSLVPGSATTALGSVIVAPKGIYYVQTNEGSRALVLIGEKNEAAKTIELIIGYLYAPSGC